eukprot:7391805-Prymnesium_polylepis.2
MPWGSFQREGRIRFGRTCGQQLELDSHLAVVDHARSASRLLREGRHRGAARHGCGGGANCAHDAEPVAHGESNRVLQRLELDFHDASSCRVSCGDPRKSA